MRRDGVFKAGLAVVAAAAMTAGSARAQVEPIILRCKTERRVAPATGGFEKKTDYFKIVGTSLHVWDRFDRRWSTDYCVAGAFRVAKANSCSVTGETITFTLFGDPFAPDVAPMLLNGYRIDWRSGAYEQTSYDNRYAGRCVRATESDALEQ